MTRGQDWYKQELQSPKWQALRAKVYKRDSRTCVDCGSSGVMIICHHLHYVKGRPPWDYPPSALITVCNQCHDNRHKLETLRFDCHEDAEMWHAATEFEAKLITDELMDRDDRINWLEDHAAIWNEKGRFWALTDEKGRSHFYDEDGNPS